MSRCKRFASECKRGCSMGSCAAENAYCPSNGTEGMSFEDDFCRHCLHDNPNSQTGGCEIILRAMFHYPTDPEYPLEWIMKAGKPHCTKYQKWDWGDGDPDDPDNPNRLPDPPDPRQLNLFPLLYTEPLFQCATSPQPSNGLPLLT